MPRDIPEELYEERMKYVDDIITRNKEKETNFCSGEDKKSVCTDSTE